MIRFAIWAAVSSKAQAETDKVSLSEQESRSRTAGLAKGWIETVGPFIVPGESRTRWINLRDAEDAIPALKSMLDAAQHGAFDVLVLYDFTRLRELLDPVARTLSAYRVQLYSLAQPIDPVPPETENDTANILQFISSFTSRTEIAAIRRRYKLGMPRRISERGLPLGSPPYGYRKPPGLELDPNAVPIQDPAKAAVVIQIKDLYIAGASLWQVARRLTGLGVPTPSGRQTWTAVMIRKILNNRFYCGEVHFGATRRYIDPRNGRVSFVKNPPARIVKAQGVHLPLWDMDAQFRLEEVLERRGFRNNGRHTHRLSTLLYCGVCGARVYAHYNGGYAVEKLRWICKVTRAHVNLLDSRLVPRIAHQLGAELKNLDHIRLPDVVDHTPLWLDSLKDLKARRSRLLDGYEGGVLSLTDYTSRVAGIDAQLTEMETRLSTTKNKTHRGQQHLAAMGGLVGILDKVPDYIAQAPEQEVNAQLCQILQRITITNESIDFTFL
jgi:hypothetical protein